jgi:glycine cleavage system transcriptional repressor
VSSLVVTAIGVDRPGIIARVAEALAGRGLNVTDSQMGILRGHFALTLVAEGVDVDADGLGRDLDDAARELGLEWVGVREVDEAVPAAPDVATHAVTVYGADHPGIVAAVARALADAQINVCDLRTRLTGEGVYVMVMEIAAAVGGDPAALLAPVAAVQGVEVSVNAVDADLL